MNYIVTTKSNPNAEPFVLGSGGFWHVEANSPEEAIEKVASGFWEPMREQTKSELIAYLKRPSEQLVTCAICSKPLEYAEQFECSTCDRTVCRACSNNDQTLDPAIRCKVCLPTQLPSEPYQIEE